MVNSTRSTASRISTQNTAPAEINVTIETTANASKQEHVAIVFGRLKRVNTMNNINKPELSKIRKCICEAYYIGDRRKACQDQGKARAERETVVSKLTQLLDKQVTALYISLRKWGAAFNGGQQPSKSKCGAIAECYFEHYQYPSSIANPCAYDKLEANECYGDFLARFKDQEHEKEWIEFQKTQAEKAWVECAGLEHIKKVIEL